MILDIETFGDRLRISYYDQQGKVKLKDYRVPDCSDWSICSPSDPKRSMEYKNWDGSSVKKRPAKFLNKFSVLEFIQNLPPDDKAEITALNFPAIQSVDIETEIMDSFPDPNVARERITAIAIATEDCKVTVFGWKEITEEKKKWIYDQQREYLKDFGEWEFKYVCFENEHSMLLAFIQKVLPRCSMVTGWNFSQFDWKYITNRCKRIGINVADASPSRRVMGKEEIPLHIGICDYMEIYKKWDRYVKVKESNSLDFVSNAVLGVTKIKYPGTLKQLYEEDYDKFILYNAIDSALVCLIHKKLKITNAAFSVSVFCDLPLYKCNSPVALTEALLWKGYYKRKMVIADEKLETPKQQYEGAYVKEPVPGFYRAVTCFDYASLYPSIMRQFNISPESFIKKETDPAKLEEAKKDRSKIVAASGSIYGTELSVMKEILTNLYSDRRKHKDLHLELERYLAKRKK